MRCHYDSRNCTGEPRVHLRRILETQRHPDSTPTRVILIVTKSEPAGHYCAKHAQELLYDECFEAAEEHP